MKQTLALTTISALITIPAVAVQKCVALNPSSITCEIEDPGYSTTDWTSTCTTNNITIPIKGIATCSKASAAVGATTDGGLPTVNSPSDTTSHKFCWCKVTSPATSKWVFLGTSPSAGSCAYHCARNCAYSIQNITSGLFGSLSD